jgi:hypothetical protein
VLVPDSYGKLRLVSNVVPTNSNQCFIDVVMKVSVLRIRIRVVLFNEVNMIWCKLHFEI